MHCAYRRVVVLDSYSARDCSFRSSTDGVRVHSATFDSIDGELRDGPCRPIAFTLLDHEKRKFCCGGNGAEHSGRTPWRKYMSAVGRLVIGTAGWQIPACARAAFPDDGTALQRYATRFDAVEINSTFRRSHRLTTYARWAESVPHDFRFAAKVPRSVSHDLRLLGCRDPLYRFLAEVAELGDKLGCVLVQLPPSLEWQRSLAMRFFKLLRSQFSGAVIVEPRHPSWFTDEADKFLVEHEISRAAADPAIASEAAHPGGARSVVYFRLHGSPRTYYSRYDRRYIARVAQELRAHAQSAGVVWCIFDNTAAGFAMVNALDLIKALSNGEH